MHIRLLVVLLTLSGSILMATGGNERACSTTPELKQQLSLTTEQCDHIQYATTAYTETVAMFRSEAAQLEKRQANLFVDTTKTSYEVGVEAAKIAEAQKKLTESVQALEVNYETMMQGILTPEQRTKMVELMHIAPTVDQLRQSGFIRQSPEPIQKK